MDFLERFNQIQNLIDMTTPHVVRRRKVYHRPTQCPLEVYDDTSFKKRYRFSKLTVVNIILPEVKEFLQKANNRGLPLSPLMQLLTCLRFYATGCFQTVCGDLGGISQSTVCRIVGNVSRILASKMGKFIKIPNVNGRFRYMEQFQQLGKIGANRGLQCVIGAIDCTHIKIERPRRVPDTESFRNRKGYFSLNVQVICGPNMEILNIVTRWPGSTHDSRIFANSRFHYWLENKQVYGILVGDSGYASARYMLTPITNPQSTAEERYNKCQIKTRNVIERLFGVWKRRFPCLQKGLANKLSNTANIIVSCAVLHNIALQSADNWEDIEEGNIALDPESVHNIQSQSSAEGLAFRSAVVSRDFSD